MMEKYEPRWGFAGLWRNRLVLTGGCIIIWLFLSALAVPVAVRYQWLRNPIEQFPTGLDEDGMPLGPSGKFLAGTDNLGRDVLSRVLHGTRVSLTVGVAAMLTAVVIGLAVGLLAGFRGGKMDLLLMRFTGDHGHRPVQRRHRRGRQPCCGHSLPVD